MSQGFFQLACHCFFKPPSKMASTHRLNEVNVILKSLGKAGWSVKDVDIVIKEDRRHSSKELKVLAGSSYE